MSPPQLSIMDSNRRCLHHSASQSSIRPATNACRHLHGSTLKGLTAFKGLTARHVASRLACQISDTNGSSLLADEPDIDKDFLESTRTLAANLDGEDEHILLTTEEDASSTEPSETVEANETDEDNPYTEVLYYASLPKWQNFIPSIPCSHAE